MLRNNLTICIRCVHCFPAVDSETTYLIKLFILSLGYCRAVDKLNYCIYVFIYLFPLILLFSACLFVCLRSVLYEFSTFDQMVYWNWGTYSSWSLCLNGCSSFSALPVFAALAITLYFKLCSQERKWHKHIIFIEIM